MHKGLFSPIQIKTLCLSNRIVMLAAAGVDLLDISAGLSGAGQKTTKQQLATKVNRRLPR